ncbi:MAG TPA: DUF5615 family PIN-like protein [Rhizomicrobium sp.]
MKFLVDMPLSPGVADWLRNTGHDAVHALEIGMDRAPDVEILDRAKRDERTIITADLDYPRLLALSADTEPSLILFRNGGWSDMDVIRRLHALLSTLGDDDIRMSIFVVDRDRVRRRRLPVQRR